MITSLRRLAGLTLTFVLVGPAILSAQSNSNLYDSKTATIAFATGTVYVDDKPVAIGTTLTAKQTVRTGKGSSAEIVFNNKNVINMRAETVLVLDLDRLDKGIEVKRGAIAAVLKKLDTATGGAMTVRTPTTVAGVRGTSFYLDVYDDGNTYFCLCNGALQLTDDKGNNITKLEAAEHAARNFIKRPDGFIKVEVAGLAEHDSAQLGILAEKLGTKIDWSKVEK